MEAGGSCACLEKIGNIILVSNYRPKFIVNNFSQIFESIINDDFSFSFKFMLNQHQYGFVK
jgi:hypothetical protein